MKYANPKMVKTRVREGLLYNFGKIRQANGYNTDIGDIYQDYTEVSKFVNWPAVVLIPGPERTLNEDMSDNLLHKELSVVGLAYIKDSNDSHLARELFLADIETMVGNEFTLNDETGDNVILDCWINGSEPLGYEANKPQIGFAFGITVIYRQDLQDASVAG